MAEVATNHRGTRIGESRNSRGDRSFRYEPEPGPVPAIAARRGCKERILKRLRHWAARTAPYHGAIDLADGRHFSGGPGQECLVSREQVVHSQRLYFDPIPQIAGEFYYRVASDPKKNRGLLVVGDQAPAANYEKVLPRAFCYRAIGVKQQSLVI